MKMCPGCGRDLVPDQPIIINDFSMLSAVSPLFYRGRPIKLTFSERTVVWAMMKAFPQPVTHEVILNRLDSEAEGNVIDVYCSRVRAKLRDAGAPVPFESRSAGRNAGRRSLCWILS
jgi:DNA-binding response OmpR family regulator